MQTRSAKLFLCAVLIFCLVAPAWAETYVFSAPPRENKEKGAETYGPIVEYLSRKTGQQFVYKQPDNWLSYQTNMQKGQYDLVFDGPHFVSWRVERLKHTPLVRLQGSLDFVVIARRDDEKITTFEDIAGRIVCGHAPPNLATLTLQAQFDNPSRQPFIRVVRGFPAAYFGVINKKCEGAVLPTGVYKKLDSGETQGQTRILFHSKPLPHQAISASPRIPPELQAKIREALLSPEAEGPTAMLRKRFGGGKPFIAATTEEYVGYGYLLKDIWGFGE
jgi:ABC-type phosphate/phosphonate transport system substrate-binding protein